MPKITVPGTCSEPGCDRPWRTRNLCKRHYKRRQRNGTLPTEWTSPYRGHRRPTAADAPPCSEPDCARPSRSRGLCDNCYARRARAGTLPDRWDTPDRPTGDRHGSYAMFAGRGCRCAVCEPARARAMKVDPYRVERFERLAADPTIRPHGDYSTYANWGCRCPDCTAVHGQAQVDKRLRRKSNQRRAQTR